MAKQLLFHKKAREALLRGVDVVGNAVKITLGPRGRNVVLEKGYGAPTITNDGVSIAKEITLPDKFENMGAEIVKEVASKTNDVAGDGTSTAVVLTQALVGGGLEETNKGVNAMGIRLGIEAAAAAVVAVLKVEAKQIKKEDVKKVATIAAESAEIGAIIAETINKVGKDGVVTVEESQTFGIESDIVEGLQFDKGYVSPYMVTNAERMEADYGNASILVTDKKIGSIQEILPLLEKLANAGKKELVIIADDVEGEALTTFVLNKLRGTFSVLAVKAPGYGDAKKEMLQDIAVITGAKVVSEDVGVKLESAELSMLGRAGKIIATKDTTTIVGGKGKKAELEARMTQIKKAIENTDSKYEREKLQERLGKLSGGVAVIRVGAATETEMKYLKLKIEDAVNATKAAIDEGIVPGGGTALLKAAGIVAKKRPKPTLDSFKEEFEIGVDILLAALEVPLEQIAQNAGKKTDAIRKIMSAVREGKEYAGYNALTDEIVPDMLAEGIIDPVKVTRSGVENAASAAAILLTTEAAVTEEPKEEKEPPMPMGY